ncbi:MAG: hypothetical protein AAB397_02485 [Patescibacteria group bacterium]
MKWLLACGIALLIIIMGFASGVFLGHCERVHGAEMVSSSVFAKRDYYTFQAAQKDYEFLEVVKEILNKDKMTDELFNEVNIAYNELAVLTKKYKIVIGIFDNIADLESGTRIVIEQDKETIAILFSRQEIFDACLEKFR